MTFPNDIKPSTLAAQAGGVIDLPSGGVVPPVQPSTTFLRDEDYALVNPDNIYSRDNSDIVRITEKVLARLEHAEEALLFPSGMAAIAALFRTLPNGGSIVVQSGIYWGTTKWLRDFSARRQINLHEVDAADPDALAAACAAHTPGIVFIETPSNPWLKTVDIAHAAQCAHAAGALLAVDSTAATPVLQRPLEFGADIVMHSATKGINGHSDVTISFLISAIAFAGFRPFGQVLVQFMIVWQRYSRNGSSRLSSRSPVARRGCRFSQRYACNSAAGPRYRSLFHQ
jgi:cystathionine gamma-synthase